MARRAAAARRTRIEDHHAEWLSLVETSGPFLTVPALKRALPDGLEAIPAIMPDLRVAYAEWRDDPGLQQRWIRWVLDELLGLRDATAEATEADPSHRVAEHGVTLRALLRRARPHPRRRPGRPARPPPSPPAPRSTGRSPARRGRRARSTAPPSSPAPAACRSRS